MWALPKSQLPYDCTPQKGTIVWELTFGRCRNTLKSSPGWLTLTCTDPLTSRGSARRNARRCEATPPNASSETGSPPLERLRGISTETIRVQNEGGSSGKRTEWLQCHPESEIYFRESPTQSHISPSIQRIRRSNTSRGSARGNARRCAATPPNASSDT
jgi:hypothetical protein